MKFDANGWLDEAIEIDCLENTSSRNGRAIKYIVQHGTAGGSSAEAIGNFYKSTVGGNNPVSTHFAIGKDGHIVQCVPLSLAAWANGVIGAGHASYITDGINPNEYTASIEYVKNQVDANGVPDNSDELTDAQKLAGFRLNKCICETYNIPKRAGDASGGIIRHADIDPVNRARCPGTFDFNALFTYLNSGGQQPMSNIPAGWHDDGTTLTASNGHHVIQGFRDYILNHSNWDPQNVPLEDVETATAVEDYYASTGGTRQLFNYTELAWTSARGVYVVGIGNELKGARAERDALKVQVAQLKALPNVANLLKINGLASDIVKASTVQ